MNANAIGAVAFLLVVIAVGVGYFLNGTRRQP